MTVEKNLESKSMRPFFIVWSGQAISLFGSQLVQFALIWWLTKETGSATVLAAASIVALLPQALLGPIAGTFVDRWNRRWTMFVADSLVALATVLLAVLFMTGMVEIWHVYAIMFVRSAAGAFHWPAMAASTTLMVPEKHLARIQGLNQTLHGALSIMSAPLAAILLGFMTIEGILAIDVVTLFFAIIPLLFIAIPQPKKSQPISEQPGEEAGSSFWAELKEGLRYVVRWPGLLIVLIMATLINFVLTPAFSLLPLVVTDHFKEGALQLGWLNAAWGIGVVVGGVLLGIWGGFSRRIKTTLVGLVIMGVFVTLFGLTPGSMFVMAVGLLFLVGTMNPIVNGPVLAVVQSIVAPEMQGRVFGLVASSVSIMSPLGLAIAGPMADTLGVQVWFVVGGAATAAIGIAGFFIPAVYHIEDGHEEMGRQEPLLVSAGTTENVKDSAEPVSM